MKLSNQKLEYSSIMYLIANTCSLQQTSLGLTSSPSKLGQPSVARKNKAFTRIQVMYLTTQSS